MPKPKKTEIIKAVGDKFSKAKGAYFTDYKGMSVSQMNDLRGEFFEADIDYNIVKKTLTKRAAKKAGYDDIDALIDGQMGIAFSYDDPVVPAKVISSFLKKNKVESPRITGCIFEGQYFGADRVSEIKNLPSRDELIGKFMGTLNAPMGNLVNVLRSSLSNLVGALNALKDKKES